VDHGQLSLNLEARNKGHGQCPFNFGAVDVDYLVVAGGGGGGSGCGQVEVELVDIEHLFQEEQNYLTGYWIKLSNYSWSRWNLDLQDLLLWSWLYCSNKWFSINIFINYINRWW
jgi:hypothetical protein